MDVPRQAPHLSNPPPPSRVCFGEFVLDLNTGELFSGAENTLLQEQPLQILRMLIEARGGVVSRDDVRRQLWPDDTVVEFDHSINTAIRNLRRALADSAQEPRYIETLARRGYRLMVPVEPKPNGFEPAPKRLWVILAFCIAAIGLVAGVAWYAHSGRTARIDSIAVLPFTNGGGDANTEYLSDGITESLIDSLAHVPQLKVKSRNLVFRYKGKDLDARKIGSDLGVSALVTGRVVPRGDNIEVSAELTDARDNTVIWGRHYSGKSAEIISLQQQIAGDLAQNLRSNLSSSEKHQVTNEGTQNPEAYEFYLKGRYAWNKRTATDLEAAISYFNQAIAKDPGYALAYAGLADVYLVLDKYVDNATDAKWKCNAALRKALELDPTLSHPHAVLGAIKMRHNWDFEGGEAEFKNAIELDPNDATARQWYAENIGRIGGRVQEALDEANRAHQLDPLSPITSSLLGFAHIFARQYDEAIAVCTKLANENPTFPGAHECLATAYWGKRMYPKVMQEWKTFGQLSGDPNDSDFAFVMEQGFRAGGWKGALTKGIATQLAQRKSGSGYLSAYEIASLYADLGDKERAFQWLNTAYQEHDDGLVNLKTDFLLDPLRSDPRFADLVRKVGLPQ